MLANQFHPATPEPQYGGTMRFKMIVLSLAVLLVATFATFAQASIPQQWTFVTTSESAANAAPISYTPTGVYSPCTTGQNDNPNDSNPNCFNPLTITTDWTAIGNNPVTPVLANTFTNSSCSASGGAQTLTVKGYKLNGKFSATVTVTIVDNNGSTNKITFTGATSWNSAQFSGRFASNGPCMKSDAGNFTATMFQTISGTYNGSFESNGSYSQSGTGAVALVLATDSNFNVTGAVTALSNSGLCFSDLTIATTLANTYMSSMATGDTLEFVASDNSGNVVLFTATGTSGTGQQEGTDSNGNQKLYLTYSGLAGACSGISGVDVPFSKAAATSAPWHHGVFGGGTTGPGGFGRTTRMRQVSRW
jgi:hypothetical protein